MTQRSLELTAETGITFDAAVISEEALGWARQYNYELVTGLTDTTRKLVSQSVATFVETPGMTRGDLEKLLAPAFGENRASMIGVTEVTRAYSEATNQHQRLIRDEVGLEMRRRWDTLRDELTCAVCGPLNGMPEENWAAEFPNGPPAHVNCRCSTSLTMDDAETLRQEAVASQTAREKLLREKVGIEVQPAVAIPAQEVSDQMMYDAIEGHVGIRPNVTKYEVLDNETFDQFCRDRGEVIGIDQIAGYNLDGEITIRAGYEDSALHEFIHSSGFMPESIHPRVNEGMTQALTEDMANQLGIVARSGYTDEVDWANNYVIPLTGRDRAEVFTGYASAKDKQKYLAELIWDQHGHRFTIEEGWGERVRENFMRHAANSVGQSDTYLTYLVDELHVTGKATDEFADQKVVEKRWRGRTMRIIYITQNDGRWSK